MKSQSTAPCPAPSEKVANATPKPTMAAVLSNKQSHSPMAWLDLVCRNDPDKHYIVTAVSLYEEKSRFPNFRPEYLALVVQPHPDQPQPAPAPILVKVSRTTQGHALPARLGLWGPADDTVTVVGPTTAVQIPDKRLHHLTWLADDRNAPRLKCISRFVACVHYDVPQRSIPLASTCRAFARAVLRATRSVFGGIGTQGRIALNSHVVYRVPAGMSSAHSAARVVATHWKIFSDDLGSVEEAREGRFITRPSCFARVVPLGATNAGEVARVVAAHHRTLGGL